MPSVTLVATNHPGTDTDGADFAGTFPTNVQTENGSTSIRRIVSAGTSQYDGWYIDALPPAGSIISVTHRSNYQKNNGANLIKGMTRIGGTRITTTYSDASGGGYITESEAAVRPGGGSWVPSDFPGGGAGTQIGYADIGTDGAGQSNCSSVRLDLVYNPPSSGSLLWLLGGWVVPLLGLIGGSLSKQEIFLEIAGWKRKPGQGPIPVPCTDEDWDNLKMALVTSPAYNI